MRNWNALVTVRDKGWEKALRLLRPLGHVAETRFFNVVLVDVEDRREFLDALRARAVAEPGVLDCLGRVAPADLVFTFQTLEEFEARARDVVEAAAPALAGKSFHLRVHRRGFRGQISSQAEERLLSGVLLGVLEAAGTPGRVAFEDPDAVVAFEIVGSQAGFSVFTREALARYPFLRPG